MSNIAYGNTISSVRVHIDPANRLLEEHTPIVLCNDGKCRPWTTALTNVNCVVGLLASTDVISGFDKTTKAKMVAIYTTGMVSVALESSGLPDGYVTLESGGLTIVADKKNSTSGLILGRVAAFATKTNQRMPIVLLALHDFASLAYSDTDALWAGTWSKKSAHDMSSLEKAYNVVFIDASDDPIIEKKEIDAWKVKEVTTVKNNDGAHDDDVPCIYLRDGTCTFDLVGSKADPYVVFSDKGIGTYTAAARLVQDVGHKSSTSSNYAVSFTNEKGNIIDASFVPSTVKAFVDTGHLEKNTLYYISNHQDVYIHATPADKGIIGNITSTGRDFTTKYDAATPPATDRTTVASDPAKIRGFIKTDESDEKGLRAKLLTAQNVFDTWDAEKDYIERVKGAVVAGTVRTEMEDDLDKLFKNKIDKDFHTLQEETAKALDNFCKKFDDKSDFNAYETARIEYVDSLAAKPNDPMRVANAKTEYEKYETAFGTYLTDLSTLQTEYTTAIDNEAQFSENLKIPPALKRTIKIQTATIDAIADRVENVTKSPGIAYEPYDDLLPVQQWWQERHYAGRILTYGDYELAALAMSKRLQIFIDDYVETYNNHCVTVRTPAHEPYVKAVTTAKEAWEKDKKVATFQKFMSVAFDAVPPITLVPDTKKGNSGLAADFELILHQVDDKGNRQIYYCSSNSQHLVLSYINGVTNTYTAHFEGKRGQICTNVYTDEKKNGPTEFTFVSEKITAAGKTFVTKTKEQYFLLPSVTP